MILKKSSDILFLRLGVINNINVVSQELTKEYLDQRLEAMESRVVGYIQDINASFNKSQGEQNHRFENRFNYIDQEIGVIKDDVHKIKLAVVDLMGTDKHLHNLVRELKGNGIALDE